MKRVLIVTDISGLGNCSGSTDIAVLSSMGIECCMVPTVVLSAQTGFKNSYALPLDESLKGTLLSLQKLSPGIDAVIIGFLANKYQTEYVLSYIKQLVNTNTVIITDPITGDNGKRFDFISDNMFSDIRMISEKSTVITPNITEFCLLTNTDYTAVQSLCDSEKYDFLAERCAHLFDNSEKRIIITGIELVNGNISNLIIGKNRYTAVEAKRYGGSYSGTGDLFTAIVCGYIMRGMPIEYSAEKASGFVSRVLSENTIHITDRNYGIPYQTYLRELSE